MTDAEKKLWSKIRNRQLIHTKFRRQHPVGSYILDFFCPERNLCIEIDGSQHLQSTILYYDTKRSAYLKHKGILVLRYSDRDVLLNLNAVLEDILNQIKNKDLNSSPLPSPQRGEETTREKHKNKEVV